MSRKGVGLGAFDRSRITSAQFASHGTTLRTANAEGLETQLAVFRSLLQQFASTHGRAIRSSPEFRAQFARMCAAIGVDPLASSSAAAAAAATSSSWAQLLGRSVHDFYFELAVRLVEVCADTRDENGGLLSVHEARERVMRARREAGGDDISDDDVRRAITALAPLGCAYAIVDVGTRPYIRSVPRELNTDQTAVLEVAQLLGYVAVSMLVDNLRWTAARARTALEDLVMAGMLWVDKQADEWEYWSPSYLLDEGTSS